MIERPSVKLALGTGKTPLRAGQLPGPSASAPATQAELDAAPRTGVVPRSLGLACVDIDAGTLPLADRVAAIKRIFGEPAGRQDTPRQGGGVHLFYPADCAFTLGSFDLNGAVAGDVKHDRQYVVTYDDDAIMRARNAAMDMPLVTQRQLRALCDHWTAPGRHDTLIRRSFEAAVNGEDAEVIGTMARIAGKSDREVQQALRGLPGTLMATGTLKLSQLQWAKLFAADRHLAERDGLLMEWSHLDGWIETDKLRLGTEFGDFVGDKLDTLHAKHIAELHQLFERLDEAGCPARTLAALVKNASGTAALKDRYQSKSNMEQVAQVAVSLADRTPWDAKADVVGLPGARLWSLSDGALRAAKPEYRITSALADAPADHCDDWLAWLKATVGTQRDGDLWPDWKQRLAWLQRLCGNAVIGNADAEAILILLGGEGTGKSTLREALADAVGGYATALNGHDLVGQSSRHAQWKMPLRFARLAAVAELPPTQRSWQCDVMKALASGDKIEAHWMGENSVRFKSRALLVISANQMPGVGGTTKGLTRRFRIVRMDRALPRDGSKARIEGGAWRGQIVRWLVDGARMYLADGEGEVPRSVADEVAKWQADNDTVALFAEAVQLRIDEDGWIAIGDLREAFVRWARKNDIKMAPQALSDALCGDPWNARRERRNGTRVLLGVSATLSDLPF